MLTNNGFVLLVLAGFLGVPAAAGAADANKADAVKMCQRSCGDPVRTDAAKYELCMIDCKSKAPNAKKLKNDPRIH